MKQHFTRLVIGIALLFAFSMGQLMATTFTTAAAGNWTSALTWVGGVAPDPESLNGNDIILNHNVTVQNNNVKLNSGATLTANGVNFTMNGGNLIIEDGNATFTNCTILIAHGWSIQQTSSAASLSMVGCQVEVGQNFQNSEGDRYLEDVCLIVDENYQNDKGTDTLINVCAIIGDSTSGNFQNNSNSSMYIQNSEFNLENGDFQNQSSATLSGTITAIWVQNGNLQNSGSWTATVSDYCVSQQVTVPSAYLPSAQNCTTISNYFNPCTCGAGAPSIDNMLVVDVLCFGDATGSIDLTVSAGVAPYTYLWSNGAATEDISNITAGTYSVTVTDANGNTATGSATVNEPTALIISTSSSNTSCNSGSDGTASVSASGGTPSYSYLWSNGGTTATISGLSAGSYSVSVADANGCTTTSTTTVMEPTALGVTVSVTNVSCNGYADGSMTASASGGTSPYSYAWSNGGTNASITSLSAGTYTVTVTDANGCVTTGSGMVSEPTVLNIAATVNNSVTCNGGSDGSASASASGGTAPYTYAWTNGGSTATNTGLSAGTYSVTATDANGCTASASVNVNEPSALTASVTATDVTCNGYADGSMTASASGGTSPYSYAWSNGGTNASITSLSAGTYTVTVTDANGCVTTGSGMVSEPTVLNVAATVNNSVTCNGGSDGSASASASGGTAPYTYTWTNGGSTATISGLSAGTYSVTATDANGCTASASVNVNEPSAVSVAVINSVDATCSNATDGEATASASGGTSPYSYVWSDGQTASTASNLAPGTYSVTATNASGCTGTASVTIGSGNGGDPCVIGPGEFRTQTQGGWGTSCNGNNPGCYRDANFASAFPAGLVVGCNFTLTLTNSAAAEAYLPCGGPSSVLTANHVDPSCLSNVVLSQLVTATLSVGFDAYDANFGSSNTLLGDLIIASGPMAGLTVNQVLAEANNAVGGCGSTYTLQQLNQTLTSINENFVDGTMAGDDLECPPNPCSTIQPAPNAQPFQFTGITAWPNPSTIANPINVGFDFAFEAEVKAEVFSMTGDRLIHSENMGVLDAGNHIYTWDGSDNNGTTVTEGMYFIRISSEEQFFTVKIVRQ